MMILRTFFKALAEVALPGAMLAERDGAGRAFRAIPGIRVPIGATPNFSVVLFPSNSRKSLAAGAYPRPDRFQKRGIPETLPTLFAYGRKGEPALQMLFRMAVSLEKAGFPEDAFEISNTHVVHHAGWVYLVTDYRTFRQAEETCFLYPLRPRRFDEESPLGKAGMFSLCIDKGVSVAPVGAYRPDDYSGYDPAGFVKYADWLLTRRRS